MSYRGFEFDPRYADLQRVQYEELRALAVSDRRERRRLREARKQRTRRMVGR